MSDDTLKIELTEKPAVDAAELGISAAGGEITPFTHIVVDHLGHLILDETTGLFVDEHGRYFAVQQEDGQVRLHEVEL